MKHIVWTLLWGAALWYGIWLEIHAFSPAQMVVSYLLTVSSFSFMVTEVLKLRK